MQCRWLAPWWQAGSRRWKLRWGRASPWRPSKPFAARFRRPSSAAQQAGGVDTLRALGKSFPDVEFWPTGGITRATAPSYLALSNVVCVGGSWVAPSALLEAADWDGVAALARDAAALSRGAAILR